MFRSGPFHILARTLAAGVAGVLTIAATTSAVSAKPGPESHGDTAIPGLVPKPLQVTAKGGADFTLTEDTRIVVRGAERAAAEEVGELLATTLRPATGFELPVVATQPSGRDIVLSIDPDADYGAAEGNPEAYRLSSSSARVRVTGATRQGLFDGTQTLRQLLPAFAGSDVRVNADWRVPAVAILDAPRFGYRGIMLDVARSFLEVDEVRKVIDAASAAKLSVLHLHLADDQGWRIEITNSGRAAGDDIDYTALTRVSGATAVLGNPYQSADGHTGYYTQDDYRDLIDYAAEREVEIIPEIDIPGHTNAALAAIPQLNTAGSSHPATEAEPTAPHNGSIDVGYSYLDPGSEATYTFIEHVFGQLAAMTPSDYLHVGGDESHAMTQRYGHEGYVEFVERAVGIVHGLGKRTIGWNEYAETVLEPGDGVQYWAGATDHAKRAVAEDGAKLLVSPGNMSYLDMKYHPKTPIGLSWACSGDCDVQHYYDWSPQEVVPGVGDEDILGTEAPLWSETVRGVEQAEFMIFPRALAHGEVGWTAESLRSPADFADRLASVGTRLAIAGTNFYDGPQIPWSTALAGTDATASAGGSTDIAVGQLAAPGTKAAEDGTEVAVDSVDDADSTGGSSLTGPLTAVVDFGDGSAPVPARFAAEVPRGALDAAGVYAVTAPHAYAAPGTYRGTVTASDGTVAAFTVTVSGD
ncbi:MAG: family 20 glycosylhydrolase [Nocardioides sp.]|uniref:family 20 glycosylhydrolase n=1 Tax=Nocardioides sp. TaxID=35761 RepID=UPI003D6B099F